MPGLKPQIKRLAIKATIDYEHLFRVRMSLAAKYVLASGRKRVNLVYSPVTSSMLRVSSSAVPSIPLWMSTLPIFWTQDVPIDSS